MSIEDPRDVRDKVESGPAQARGFDWNQVSSQEMNAAKPQPDSDPSLKDFPTVVFPTATGRSPEDTRAAAAANNQTLELNSTRTADGARVIEFTGGGASVPLGDTGASHAPSTLDGKPQWNRPNPVPEGPQPGVGATGGEVRSGEQSGLGVGAADTGKQITTSGGEAPQPTLRDPTPDQTHTTPADGGPAQSPTNPPRGGAELPPLGQQPERPGSSMNPFTAVANKEIPPSAPRTAAGDNGFTPTTNPQPPGQIRTDSPGTPPQDTRRPLEQTTSQPHTGQQGAFVARDGAPPPAKQTEAPVIEPYRPAQPSDRQPAASARPTQIDDRTAAASQASTGHRANQPQERPSSQNPEIANRLAQSADAGIQSRGMPTGGDRAVAPAGTSPQERDITAPNRAGLPADASTRTPSTGDSAGSSRPLGNQADRPAAGDRTATQLARGAQPGDTALSPADRQLHQAGKNVPADKQTASPEKGAQQLSTNPRESAGRPGLPGERSAMPADKLGEATGKDRSETGRGSVSDKPAGHNQSIRPTGGTDMVARPPKEAGTAGGGKDIKSDIRQGIKDILTGKDGRIADGKGVRISDVPLITLPGFPEGAGRGIRLGVKNNEATRTGDNGGKAGARTGADGKRTETGKIPGEAESKKAGLRPDGKQGETGKHQDDAGAKKNSGLRPDGKQTETGKAPDDTAGKKNSSLRPPEKTDGKAERSTDSPPIIMPGLPGMDLGIRLGIGKRDQPAKVPERVPAKPDEVQPVRGQTPNQPYSLPDFSLVDAAESEPPLDSVAADQLIEETLESEEAAILEAESYNDTPAELEQFRASDDQGEKEAESAETVDVAADEHSQRSTYTVAEGETLESIAAKLFQDRLLSLLLLEINRERIPVRLLEGERALDLRPGTVLDLPTVGQVKEFNERFSSGLASIFKYSPAGFQTPEQELAAWESSIKINDA